MHLATFLEPVSIKRESAKLFDSPGYWKEAF